jgi:hypothetical protein
MYTHQFRSLHAPMMVARRGLRGLRGTITLRTDKQAYLVGDAPIYQILGGAPNATIVWTSFKNGGASGEYQVSYGQSLDAEGKGVFTSQPWKEEDVGYWEKQVVLGNPDGTTSLAQVFFTVSKPAPTGSTTPAAEPSFFDKEFDILGQKISGGMLLGGAALGFVLLMSTMKGR